MNNKKLCQKILAQAGIKINGQNNWDIQVKNEKLYDRIIKNGSIGLGESYMDGWWDVKELDVFFDKLLGTHLDKSPELRNLQTILQILKSKFLNAGHKMYAYEIGEKHYDIGNDLFKLMLEEPMAYSCAYWKNADNLADAQIAKFDLICQKLNLQKGDKILDIGCGWGEFMKYAVEKYKVSAVGITVSEEQARWINENYKNLNLKASIKDYRDLNGKFDKIISIGMFEHVGYKNYRIYMKKIHSLLETKGLFLLHTIGRNTSLSTTDPWIEKYIFPKGMLPSIKQIAGSIEGLFVMEDWHNFGTDYDKTLMVWFDNFNKNWPKISKKYGKRFYRMWKYYLLSSAGNFRCREGQLWQVVLSKNGVRDGYKPVR